MSRRLTREALPARSASAGLNRLAASEQLGDLIGCHGFAKPLEREAHDRAPADDLAAATPYIGVLAFGEPQVVLSVEPDLAGLERDSYLRLGTRCLLASCRRPLGGWRQCDSDRSFSAPGDTVTICPRGFDTGLSGSVAVRFVHSPISSQVYYLGASFLRPLCRRGNRAGMARREWLSGTALLALLDTFAQLSHRTPLRS